MLIEKNSHSPSPRVRWTCLPGSSAVWASYPNGLLRCSASEPKPCAHLLRGEPCLSSNSCGNGTMNREGSAEKEYAACHPAHSLFQDAFFFCRIQKVADLPGAERIYVETVVDSDSGASFAKVYSERNALNAVDILATRVIPYFRRRGMAIKEIHTRNMSEYCGLPPAHPFENFLAGARIEHLKMDHSNHLDNFLCDDFYRVLVKDFFPAALRQSSQLSLADLQRSLDAFVEAHNAGQVLQEI